MPPMVGCIPSVENSMHVGRIERGGEQRMAAIHSSIEQRDTGHILVRRRGLRAPSHVAYPFGLFKRPKVTEKELGRKRCLSDLCDEIQQVDGPLKCRTR